MFWCHRGMQTQKEEAVVLKDGIGWRLREEIQVCEV